MRRHDPDLDWYSESTGGLIMKRLVALTIVLSLVFGSVVALANTSGQIQDASRAGIEFVSGFDNEIQAGPESGPGIPDLPGLPPNQPPGTGLPPAPPNNEDDSFEHMGNATELFFGVRNINSMRTAGDTFNFSTRDVYPTNHLNEPIPAGLRYLRLMMSTGYSSRRVEVRRSQFQIPALSGQIDLILNSESVLRNGSRMGNLSPTTVNYENAFVGNVYRGITATQFSASLSNVPLAGLVAGQEFYTVIDWTLLPPIVVP